MANKRLIDANALLEKMQFRLPINDKTSEVIAERVYIAVRYIKNAPTVDAVEVVHWCDRQSLKRIKAGNFPVVKCSQCEVVFCDLINNHHYMYHYCPNCGAKMDGGNEDENP